MEYNAYLFLLVIEHVLKRLWWIYLIPMAGVLVHGLYTGSWYWITGVLLSLGIAVILAINMIRRG